MQTQFTDTAGKQFTATVSGNTLTMYVARQADMVMMKVPAKHRSMLTCAMRRSDFHAFGAVVDEIEATPPPKKARRKRKQKVMEDA